MNTEKERKPNSGYNRTPWRNRLIAVALAVLMLASVLLLDSSSYFFGLKANGEEPAVTPAAAPVESPAAEQDPYSIYLGQAAGAISGEDYETALRFLEECEALAPDDTELAMILIQEGNIRFSRGEYDLAEGLYDRAIALDQEEYSDSELYYMCAKCRLLLSDPEGALSDCELGLGLLKDSDTCEADIYVMRGTAYVYLGEYVLASEDYNTAIEKGYSDTETLYEQISLCSYLAGDYAQTVAVSGQTGTSSGDSSSWTCLSYYSLGRYAEAAAAYEDLLGTDQSYYTTAQIYSCIAKCRIMLGSYDEAIAKCNAGLNTGEVSEAGTLYALRATSYMSKNDFSTAISDFLTAVDCGYADKASLYAQCAACSYYLGNDEDVLKYGTAAQDVGSGDTEAVLWMALTYYEQDDYEHAGPFLERSLNISQNYCEESELRRCLSRCQLILGDYEAAGEEATLAIETSAGTASGDMYAIRGAAYVTSGRYEEALADFYAAIALGYADPYELYRQSTLCNFLLGDYEQAISCSERAMENQSEEDAALYYWTGISYFSLGQYDEGKANLLRASELDDSLENLYFYLGVCCFSLEEYKTAATYFTLSANRNETVERSIYNRALCELMTGNYTATKQDLETVASQQADPEIAEDAAKLLESLATIL